MQREEIELKGRETSQASARHLFRLSGKVKEGDEVRYRLRVSDNRKLSGAGLEPQAPGVDAPRDFDVEARFNRLEQVHDQRVVGIESAGAEAFAQAVPVGRHERDVQPLVVVEALLLRDENRRFTGQAEVCDP